MGDLLAAAWEGLRLVFSWPNILYPVSGTLLAMVVAFLPGVSGATLMALAIPFTLTWEPLPIALLFGGLVGGATFMGSVTAILFNVPGSGPSAATLIDGHPLARQGLARTALGCAALSSALGSTVGILLLILLLPVMRPAIVAFGSPELLVLALWGLVTVAAISRGSGWRALGIAGLGCSSPSSGTIRARVSSDSRSGGGTFGTAWLWCRSCSDSSRSRKPSIWQCQTATRSPEARARSSSAEACSMALAPCCTTWDCCSAAHSRARSSASFPASAEPSRVFSPMARPYKPRATEAALATVTSAVSLHRKQHTTPRTAARCFQCSRSASPGQEGTAVLMAALLLHGIVPGRELLTDRLPLVFVLIWSLFLSNWLTSLVGLLVVRPLAALTVVRVQSIAPIILALVCLGAYLSEGRIADVGVAFLFGVAGYYMKKHGWPRIPFVIALLLGGAIELELARVVATAGARARRFARPARAPGSGRIDDCERVDGPLEASSCGGSR